ncbi:ATP-binding protein [Massilia sp. CFBP9012]|uniref:sensor histidine kinase n=1 Tax=Massilia sp. CFBP9012 TaxID=3096531 RepID=UPI002A6A5BD2|nr:ATP-binding protein [Massilia sp. CFBP9012]MDY0978215.1 ATP-binding protein [Massilia sp. CFBP9012]
MRLNSIRLKIVMAFVAGTLLSVMLVVLVAAFVLQTNVLARTDLADMAQDLSAKVYVERDGRLRLGTDAHHAIKWAFDSLGREVAYRVVDRTGNVALLSEAGPRFWPAGVLPASAGRTRFEFTRDGVTFFGASEPLALEGRDGLYLQVAASSRMMYLLHRVALPLVAYGIALFTLVLLVAFGLCTWITLRYTLKPLQDVSGSAAGISLRSMHARLRTDAVPSEIAPLVDSFNRALERLEQAYRAQQEFLGNAAHELKTPLAMIRAQVELGVDGEDDRAALLKDVAYMSRQVQQLLLLAEASEATNYVFGTVRVREVADEAIGYLQRMAEAADVTLAVSAMDDGLEWQADRGALFTLMKNLLENAIEHAPAGSRVSVEIAEDRLCVRDHGPGVEAAQLALLFDRFWRGPHRRDLGAGLGLSICQEVARAHGWRLAAERAEPGLRFTLSAQTRRYCHWQ